MQCALEPGITTTKPPRLLDQVRARAHSLQRSSRTEEVYVEWIKRYIRFFDKRHPRDLGAGEIDQFLTHLAVEETFSTAKQLQARSALSFLYGEVLRVGVEPGNGDARATGAGHSPAALTREEVDDVLRHLRSPSHRLICRLIYGAGLTLVDVLQLRVDDIDLARAEIRVANGRGSKKTVAALSRTLVDSLEEHLAAVQALHRVDVAAGHGNVYLPLALARKHPGAARD